MRKMRPCRGSEGLKRWKEIPTGRCTQHGKILYKTRKQARQAIRAMGERPSEMDAYPCMTVDNHWHVGHKRGGK